jgi:hypothetical protein
VSNVNSLSSSLASPLRSPLQAHAEAQAQAVALKRCVGELATQAARPGGLKVNSLSEMASLSEALICLSQLNRRDIHSFAMSRRLHALLDGNKFTTPANSSKTPILRGGSSGLFRDSAATIINGMRAIKRVAAGKAGVDVNAATLQFARAHAVAWTTALAAAESSSRQPSNTANSDLWAWLADLLKQSEGIEPAGLWNGPGNAFSDAYLELFKVLRHHEETGEELRDAIIARMAKYALVKASNDVSLRLPIIRGCAYALNGEKGSSSGVGRGEEVAAALQHCIQHFPDIQAALTACPLPVPGMPLRILSDVFAHAVHMGGRSSPPLSSSGVSTPLHLATVRRAFQIMEEELGRIPALALNSSAPSNDCYRVCAEIINSLSSLGRVLGSAQVLQPSFWMYVEALLPQALDGLHQSKLSRGLKRQVGSRLLTLLEGGARGLCGSSMSYGTILDAIGRDPELIRDLEDGAIARSISLLALIGYWDVSAVQCMLTCLGSRPGLEPALKLNIMSSLIALNKMGSVTCDWNGWYHDCVHKAVAPGTLDPAFVSQLHFVELYRRQGKHVGASGRKVETENLSFPMDVSMSEADFTTMIAAKYRKLLVDTLHSRRGTGTGTGAGAGGTTGGVSEQLEIHQASIDAAAAWGAKKGLGAPIQEYIDNASTLSIDFAWPEAKLAVEIQGLPHFLPRAPLQQLAELQYLAATSKEPEAADMSSFVRFRTHVARSGRSAFVSGGVSRGEGTYAMQETSAEVDFGRQAHRNIISPTPTPRTAMKLRMLQCNGWRVCAIPVLRMPPWQPMNTAEWKTFVQAKLEAAFGSKI